ncbi:MAG: hypothetical protein HY401_02970 [Elusimicrobia bacterium]|nr:hypothetical protein [Elusimicrobiota bacterium]
MNKTAIAGLILLANLALARANELTEVLRRAEHLPYNFLLPVASRLEIRYVDDPDVNVDFLQREKRPTLAVNRSHRKPDGGFPEIVAMAASDYYLTFVLFEAYVDLGEMKKQSPAYASWIKKRARELMQDVPKRYREEAYFFALADFLGLAFTHANSIERQRVQRYEQFCVYPQNNFTYWEQIFRMPYHGIYFPRDKEGFFKSAHALTAMDIRLAMTHLLRGFWTGDAKSDFIQKYCVSSPF